MLIAVLNALGNIHADVMNGQWQEHIYAYIMLISLAGSTYSIGCS